MEPLITVRFVTEEGRPGEYVFRPRRTVLYMLNGDVCDRTPYRLPENAVKLLRQLRRDRCKVLGIEQAMGTYESVPGKVKP